MSLHARAAILALAATLAACGSDGAETDAEVEADTGFREEETGPEDEEDAVEIEIPVEPRRFLLGAGAQVLRLDAGSADLSWSRIGLDADVVAVFLDAGAPWPELVDEAPLPAEVDAWLTALEQRLARTPGRRMVVLDPLDADRLGLVGDLLGRSDAGPPALATQAARDAWARWTAIVTDRLEPDYVSPIVEPNLAIAGAETLTDPLVELYSAARIAAQDVDETVRVFPIWDVETLEQSWEEQTPAQVALFELLDERQDLFAVNLNPADGLRTASDLAAGELAFLPELSRRPIGLVGVGYPAAGFVRGADVFASSENSQFNFLAWLLTEADALDAELVVWRLYVDPNEVLAAPCATAGEPCDEAAASAALERWRSCGLWSAAGAERRALDLWRQFRARPLRGG
jgi:hypothetical protein